MKRTIRFAAAGPQIIREALNSRLLQGFVIASGTYYALLLASSFLDGSALSLGLISILCQGFVTAESIILYQRKESRNLKHLSIFCLTGMIVMFLLCLFLGSVVLTLKGLESGAQTEEIMQMLADMDLSQNMPYMIATVVAAGLNGLEMLFLWKTFGMCADIMERKGELKNWFLPAAIAAGLNTAMIFVLTVLQPGGVLGAAAALVSVVRDGLLTVLLAKTAMRCKEIMG